MNNLIIYPTFLCPFSCNYCLFKKKLSLNEQLFISDLEKYLNENINDVDEIIVSGGDFLSLNDVYMKELVETLNKYNKKWILQIYPYNLDKIKHLELGNNVVYEFSYDFLGKPRASEAWVSMLNFDKPFKVVITLSPLLFKYHPNQLLKKLSLLPNLTSVEFIPYYKNEYSRFDITKNNNFTDITKMILNCRLSLPFEITNKVKIQQKLLGNSIVNKEIHLFPNGKTYHQHFTNDIVEFIENDGRFDNVSNVNIPESINMYSEEICQWYSSNVI